MFTHAGVLLCSLMLLSAVGIVEARGNEIEVGDRCPDLEGDGLDGQSLSISAIADRGPTLVTFWATWCRPCGPELVAIQRLALTLQHTGFRVLAVSVDLDRNRDRTRAFLEQSNITLPVLFDPEQNTMKRLGLDKIPTILLLDEDRTVLWTRVGYSHGDQARLEDVIRRYCNGSIAEVGGLEDRFPDPLGDTDVLGFDAILAAKPGVPLVDYGLVSSAGAVFQIGTIPVYHTQHLGQLLRNASLYRATVFDGNSFRQQTVDPYLMGKYELPAQGEVLGFYRTLIARSESTDGYETIAYGSAAMFYGSFLVASEAFRSASQHETDPILKAALGVHADACVCLAKMEAIEKARGYVPLGLNCIPKYWDRGRRDSYRTTDCLTSNARLIQCLGLAIQSARETEQSAAALGAFLESMRFDVHTGERFVEFGDRLREAYGHEVPKAFLAAGGERTGDSFTAPRWAPPRDPFPGRPGSQSYTCGQCGGSGVIHLRSTPGTLISCGGCGGTGRR